MEEKKVYDILMHNVSKYFGNKAIISDLNLSVAPGERVAIVGFNGAGKSTLLKIMAGLLPIDSGFLLLKGVEQNENKSLLKKQIAYLPDDPPLYDLLSPLEYLEYIAALWKIPIESVKQQIFELMENYQMTSASQMWIKNFSKGMRQKLGLISVLFRSPSILLLDEPFNALDRDAIQTTIRYLQDRQFVRTVIIVTHDLDLIEQFADRVIFLHKGDVTTEFLSSEKLIEQYEEEKSRLQLEGFL